MSKITVQSFGREINGNSIVRFTISNTHQNSSVRVNGRPIRTNKPFYGYSLQTNGNLPKTHSLKIGGVKVEELSSNERAIVEGEIYEYIRRYGSDKQRYLITN